MAGYQGYNPYGYGYGGIGYVSTPTQPRSMQQAPIAQPLTTAPPNVGGGGEDWSQTLGSGSGGKASGPAMGHAFSNRSSTGGKAGGMLGSMIGRAALGPMGGAVGSGLGGALGGGYGPGQTIGSIAGGLLGLATGPLAPILSPLFSHMGGNIGAFEDTTTAAGKYGITPEEVSAGISEGAEVEEAAGPPMTGKYEGLGSLGTGGEGGIDSAGDDDGGMCFITTATAGLFGWRDDCRVLTTLRWFRDNVVLKTKEGEADVRRYYRVAPAIANAMTRPEAEKVWRDYLKKSVSAIVAGNHKRAYRIYKNMMHELTVNQV